MIYFMRAGNTGHVKIGWTKDERTLAKRRANLQCGQPFPLVVIRTIEAPRWAETWLHGFFSGVRAAGEWFEYQAEMMTVRTPDHPDQSSEEDTINVRLPRSLWEKVQESAQKTRRSASAELAVLVEQSLSPPPPDVGLFGKAP